MFDIEYKGGNAVVLSSKKVTIVADPKLSVIGLKDLNTNECVELATEERFALNSANSRLLIDGPGEYEVGDFTIKGIPAKRHIDSDESYNKSTIYRMECAGISVGLLGNVAPKLSDDQLEELGVIDILILPVGGSGYTLDATSATSIVRSVSPKAVVPVHYADSGINYEVPQESVEVFVKELGVPTENVQKLKIKNEATLPQSTTVYILSR